MIDHPSAHFVRDIVQQVIAPTLIDMNQYSEEAAFLLLGTALVESRFAALTQYGDGPARGFWQMEPATHDDIWDNYLAYRSETTRNVLETSFLMHRPPADAMCWNLRYACAMARVHYLRIPYPVPTDIRGQAQYWKDHYNTRLGAGTVGHYIEVWESVEC